MVEKETKPAEKSEKSTQKEKESERKKDTLPIDTDEMDEKNKFQELNENDEFEEFPIYKPPVGNQMLVASIDEPQELNVWEDNWEDETVEKDFALQLSEELGNPDILKPLV